MNNTSPELRFMSNFYFSVSFTDKKNYGSTATKVNGSEKFIGCRFRKREKVKGNEPEIVMLTPEMGIEN